MHAQLAGILAHKRNEIAALRKRGAWANIPQPPLPGRDFKGALCSHERISLIAEIKFASPSAGSIREKVNPVSIGKVYERGGCGIGRGRPYGQWKPGGRDQGIGPGRDRLTEDRMVRVKVCGIANNNDAQMAVETGVDALGFIFARSPRIILPEDARRIIRRLPPFVQTVGVFVNEKPADIRKTMSLCGLDLAQLHGDEPPDLCEALMPRCIKAIRVRSRSSLDQIRAYEGKVRALVLDIMFF